MGFNHMSTGMGFPGMGGVGGMGGMGQGQAAMMMGIGMGLGMALGAEMGQQMQQNRMGDGYQQNPYGEEEEGGSPCQQQQMSPQQQLLQAIEQDMQNIMQQMQQGQQNPSNAARLQRDMMLLQALMGGMNGQNGGSPFGQSPFGGSPFGGFGSPFGSGMPGGFPGGGGWGQPSSPGGAGGPVQNYTNAPRGSGQQAVGIAQHFLGQNSINLRGQLPNFQAAGGQTNDCADFVSSCLQDSGRLQGHYNTVGGLRSALSQQGYQQVDKGHAQPGDVWISASGGHTELVANQGGTQLIGSNNDRPGHQQVSYAGAGAGYYYHLNSPNN